MDLMNKIDLLVNEYENLNERKGDGEEYEKFFREMLKKYGVKEPDELSSKDKKKFFDEVEKKWKKEKK